MDKELEKLLTEVFCAAARVGANLQRIFESPPITNFLESIGRIAAGPAVPGYEAFFVGLGCKPFEARLTGLMVTGLGQRLVEQRTAQRSLAARLRELVKAHGKSPVVGARRARALRDELTSPEAQLVLETALSSAGRRESVQEFAEIVERAIARDALAFQALSNIARALLSTVPDPRGRNLSLGTATHELLLWWLQDGGKPRAYTWDDEKEEFVDPATQATRAAVADPDFDPRYAHRDLKKRFLS